MLQQQDADAFVQTDTGAAQYDTWLLIKPTPEGVVFRFFSVQSDAKRCSPFFSFLFKLTRHICR